ncbi:LOW QUALITY PROTEIN: Protein CBR-SOC-1 [Caenorhabditis briggsae]|uniref:Protein CBR-SOC-1 n=1 Tax=Caenorhabditis briggsae TaxID=6238 RepID=A8X7D3_CAEBR|nr:LOW QUALITY PROTEIN: Protein CBR-SOC-1 [Caenorhabditis briggsae]CAP28544.1 Protein CBR-SOC-1 [Caenorhabditis briggsae]
MSIPDENIILEGSLKRCKKYKLFKTKWIEHYFVLYCRDPGRNLYAIDEFKSSRKNELKKRFKMELVARVESNLSISDPSVLCSSTAQNHHPDTLHSIFGIGFRVHNVLKDLYLVAKNDEEMTLWVNEICKICKLHRQNDDDSQAADSSISGMSMSSQSLDMSLMERQQFADNPKTSTCNSSNVDESEDRMGHFNFGGFRSRPTSKRAYHSSVRKKSVAMREFARKYSSLPNTPSEASNNQLYCNAPPNANTNQTKQQKTVVYFRYAQKLIIAVYKNDSIFQSSDPKSFLRMQQFKSVNSNPNYNNLPESVAQLPYSLASYFKFLDVQNGQINRLHMIPASTSMGRVVGGDDAEESSGETMKPGTSMNRAYPDSLASSEGIPIYDLSGRTIIGRAPPPIDRSNKPRSMKSGEEDQYRKFVEGKFKGKIESLIFSVSDIKPQTINENTVYTETKRKNLDYFEPTQLIENSSSSTMAATSTRSPTPSDIEYITVDVDRTLAFKQLRRAGQSAD